MKKYFIIAIILCSLLLTSVGQASLAGNDADYPTSVTETL